MQTSFSASSSSSLSRPSWCVYTRWTVRASFWDTMVQATAVHCQESMWQRRLRCLDSAVQTFFFSPLPSLSQKCELLEAAPCPPQWQWSEDLVKAFSLSHRRQTLKLGIFWEIQESSKLTFSFFSLLQSLSNSTGNKSRNKSLGSSRLHRLKEFLSPYCQAPAHCGWKRLLERTALEHPRQHEASTVSHY